MEQVLERLQQLPESVKLEALQYLEALVAEHSSDDRDIAAPKQKKRQAGGMKGTFSLPLTEEFDAPLEDFAEYM
jgi:Protein of unknown function (DUF2281)